MKRSATIVVNAPPPAGKRKKGARSSTKQTFKVPRWAGLNKTGFPKELTIRHRYVSPLSLVSAAGALTTASFSCNGMYDPDVSGTGSQPLYFDQVASIYNHYTVTNSKITVEICPRVGVMSSYGLAGVFVNDDATVTPASSDRLAEQSTASYTMLTGFNQDPIKLRRSWSAKQNFGGNPLADPNLQGTASANPTEQQMFTIWYQELGGGASSRVDAIVTLEYTAVWQELKDIGGS